MDNTAENLIAFVENGGGGSECVPRRVGRAGAIVPSHATCVARVPACNGRGRVMERGRAGEIEEGRERERLREQAGGVEDEQRRAAAARDVARRVVRAVDVRPERGDEEERPAPGREQRGRGRRRVDAHCYAGVGGGAERDGGACAVAEGPPVQVHWAG